MSSPITPPHLGGHMLVTHTDEGALDYLLEEFPHLLYLIDVGCGPGGQVQLARTKILYSVGIDGDPALCSVWAKDETSARYILADLTKSGDRARTRLELLQAVGRPSLGWCVEFLEHVEAPYSSPIMTSVLPFIDILVVTAAPPGVVGQHHVNCQTEEYWVNFFNTHGFVLDERRTNLLRKSSTMKRNFVRERGMLFYHRYSYCR